MLMFEWNALRVGDGVQVHGPIAPSFGLIDGTVVMVDSHHARRRANDVAVRVAGSAGPEVLRPTYLSVHRPDDDGRAPCWRCESAALAAGASTPSSPAGVAPALSDSHR